MILRSIHDALLEKKILLSMDFISIYFIQQSGGPGAERSSGIMIFSMEHGCAIGLMLVRKQYPVRSHSLAVAPRR